MQLTTRILNAVDWHQKDPVTTALFTMKGSGLAENPESDLWSIHPETMGRSGIKSLNEFINWTAQLESKDYVFRGVPNETYRIQSFRLSSS